MTSAFEQASTLTAPQPDIPPGKTLRSRFARMSDEEKTLLLQLYHDELARVQAEKRELEALVEQLRIDPLTGFTNRASAPEKYRQLLAEIAGRAKRRPNAYLCAMFVDLDGFKRINDTLGHEGGDKVLQNFAAIVKDVLKRETDIALPFRHGGDEFVILLPCAEREDGLMLAQKVCNAVAESSGVTASIGVAFGPLGDHLPGEKSLPAPEKLYDLINEADQNAYKAKAAGRNQVFPAPGTFAAPALPGAPVPPPPRGFIHS